MEEPVARVVRAELDHHIATGWDQNGVHAWGGGVEGDARPVAVPPGDGGARLAVGVVEVRLVLEARQSVRTPLYEACAGVVVAVATVHHPEGVAVQVDGVGLLPDGGQHKPHRLGVGDL